MCERKPGPRCSADTRTEMYAAQEEYQNYLSDTPRDKWNVDINDALKAKREIAELKYDATPEGLKELEEKMIEAKRTGIITGRVFGVHGLIKDNDGTRPEYRAEIKVPRYLTAEADIESAKEHRKIQKNLLSMITEVENNPNDFVSPAGFAAGEKQKTERSIAEAEAKLAKARNKKTQLANDFALVANSNFTSIVIDQPEYDFSELRKTIIKIRKLDRSIAFAKLRIEDLNSYILTAQRKDK